MKLLLALIVKIYNLGDKGLTIIAISDKERISLKLVNKHDHDKSLEQGFIVKFHYQEHSGNCTVLNYEIVFNYFYFSESKYGDYPKRINLRSSMHTKKLAGASFCSLVNRFVFSTDDCWEIFANIKYFVFLFDEKRSKEYWMAYYVRLELCIIQIVSETQSAVNKEIAICIYDIINNINQICFSKILHQLDNIWHLLGHATTTQERRFFTNFITEITNP